MRKVLIPTDFSENAMNAIKYALELFKYDKTEFYIMHAYGDEVYDERETKERAVFNEIKESVFKSSNAKLEAVLKEMQLLAPNPRHAHFHISVFGSLVDEVNAMAEAENIDVIVMGTKGQSDLRDITFGSNTLQVIKYVKCPVLAVPASYHDIQPKKILFATDYMLPYQRRELKLLGTIAKNFVSRMSVLHISKFDELSFRQQDNKAFLEFCLRENKPQFIKLAGEEISKVIDEAVSNYNADLLVMINSRHSFLESMLYQSTVDKIGLNIQIPFLVLQNLPRS